MGHHGSTTDIQTLPMCHEEKKKEGDAPTNKKARNIHTPVRFSGATMAVCVREKNANYYKREKKKRDKARKMEQQSWGKINGVD